MSALTRRRLVSLLGSFDPDPAELAMLVAAEAHPDLDVNAQLARVDALADAAAGLGGGVDGVVVSLRATGLLGDTHTYDDPRNCLLPDVLDRGCGQPITLSMLTLGVARRVAVPTTAVGLPGHVVVAVAGAAGTRWFDPFSGWVPLTREDCVELVHTTAGVPFAGEHLDPVDARYLAQRMLRNLRGAYMSRRALGDALWTVELGLLVAPDDAALRRQESVLLAGVGRYAEAQAAAQAYLAAHPDGPGVAEVTAHLAAVQDMTRRMN